MKFKHKIDTQDIETDNLIFVNIKETDINDLTLKNKISHIGHLMNDHKGGIVSKVKIAWQELKKIK